MTRTRIKTIKLIKLPSKAKSQPSKPSSTRSKLKIRPKLSRSLPILPSRPDLPSGLEILILISRYILLSTQLDYIYLLNILQTFRLTTWLLLIISIHYSYCLHSNYWLLKIIERISSISWFRPLRIDLSIVSRVV
jgi:hypothetical protein